MTPPSAPDAPNTPPNEHPMTVQQRDNARRRLALGISNVGFWVLAAAFGLVGTVSERLPAPKPVDLAVLLICAIMVQFAFDWVGGTLLMPASSNGPQRFLFPWIRAVIIHTALLTLSGALCYGNFLLCKDFCLAVTITSCALFALRNPLLRWVAGTPVKPSLSGDTPVLIAESRDPSFTGGSCTIGLESRPLLPARWISCLTKSQLEAVTFRRQWFIQNHLPFKAFACSLAWNLCGCWVGSTLLQLRERPIEQALLLQSVWMTLWSFVGLLVLPTLSRSTVFAADHATAVNGLDAESWIRKYPSLTGEDGNATSIVQRLFYPIPSTNERLQALGKPARLPVLGNVARTNLFLSPSVLTLLGRSVHCNVGRPELWIFPPTD